MNFKKDAPLLFSVTLLALFLRLPWRGLIPLDIDEAFQIFVVSRPTIRALFESLYSLGPQQYPLDYLIGFAAIRFTPNIETLRLLPLVWGLASVATAYCLGRLLDGRLYGWLWALLLSISMLHIQYSITFRPYSLIVCLSLLSILFFWKSLEHRGWLWPYAVVSILYALIYPFALCKTIVDLVFVRMLKSPNRRPISWTIFSSWGVFAVMALVHIRGFAGGQRFAWGVSESWGSDILARIALQYGQYDHRVMIAFACLFTLGIVTGLRSAVHRWATAYVATLMFCTLATLLIVIPLLGLFLNTRHTLPLLPLLLGGVAISVVGALRELVSRFPQRATLLRWLVPAGSCFAFLMTVVTPLQIFKQVISKNMDVLEGQVEFMRHTLKPGDRLVFENPNAGATFVYYYDRPAFFRLEGVFLIQGFDLFKFPADLELKSARGSIRAYTLCRPSPSFATVSLPAIGDWAHEGLLNGTHTFFVNLPLNSFTVADPFREVATDTQQLTSVFPGIYRFDARQHG